MSKKSRKRSEEVVQVWKEMNEESNDALGSYTGRSSNDQDEWEKPIQDVDDL